MKKLPLTLIVLALSFATSALAADLPKDLQKRLVGTWVGFPHPMTFKKNGEATAGLGNGYSRGTWELVGDTIRVTMPRTGLHLFKILAFNTKTNQVLGEYKGKKYPVLKM
ncbi:MAG: hypothetical protein FGM15_03085 [Chthoniobacterales bacterium]|nr:hypothetical protein [Chthoniobacterales bacterium]